MALQDKYFHILYSYKPYGSESYTLNSNDGNGNFSQTVVNTYIADRTKLGYWLKLLKTYDSTPVTTINISTDPISVVLKNKLNTTSVVKGSSSIEKLGGEFATIDKKIAEANEIAGGVLVKKISSGALKNSRIQEGFVITSINGQEVKTLDEFTTLMKEAKGTIFIEGIYPGSGTVTYRYPIKLDEE